MSSAHHSAGLAHADPKISEQDHIAEEAVRDLLRDLTLRSDFTATALYRDLSYVWDGLADAGQLRVIDEERRQLAGIGCEESRWAAVPTLGLDDTGRGSVLIGSEWWNVTVDDSLRLKFTHETTQESLQEDDVCQCDDCQLAYQGLRYSMTRANIAMSSLFRDLAALDKPLVQADWWRYVMRHPLLRIAASRTVWQSVTATGMQWFVSGRDGVLRDQRGGEVTLHDSPVRVATCVNTPVEVIEEWSRYFEREGRHIFVDQFAFAGTPAAVRVNGYWRIDMSAAQSVDCGQLTIGQCDSWAYSHGFDVDVECADEYMAGNYIRSLPGQVEVSVKFEQHKLPVAANSETKLIEYASCDQSKELVLTQALPKAALRQQMYTDLLGLYSDAEWVQPPGIRCV